MFTYALTEIKGSRNGDYRTPNTKGERSSHSLLSLHASEPLESWCFTSGTAWSQSRPIFITHSRLICPSWPNSSRQTSHRRGRHIVSFRDRCRISSLTVAIDRWGVIVKWLGSPRRVRDKRITHAGIRKDRLTRPPRNLSQALGFPNPQTNCPCELHPNFVFTDSDFVF